MEVGAEVVVAGDDEQAPLFVRVARELRDGRSEGEGLGVAEPRQSAGADEVAQVGDGSLAQDGQAGARGVGRVAGGAVEEEEACAVAHRHGQRALEGKDAPAGEGLELGEGVDGEAGAEVRGSRLGLVKKGGLEGGAGVGEDEAARPGFVGGLLAIACEGRMQLAFGI